MWWWPVGSLPHNWRYRSLDKFVCYRPMTSTSLFLTFCWPCIAVYLSQYLTNLMHKFCASSWLNTKINPRHCWHFVTTDLEPEDWSSMLLRNAHDYEQWPVVTEGFDLWVLNISNILSDVDVWYRSLNLNSNHRDTARLAKMKFTEELRFFLSQFQSEFRFVAVDSGTERNAISPDETDSCPWAIFIQRRRYGGGL